MRRRRSSLIGAVLAGAALVLAACGSDEPEPAAVAAPSAEQGATSAAQEAAEAEELAVPREVIVCEPGLIDTNATVDDVPRWPGPKPADFMSPTPPSGMCGTLTGDEAKVVYEAALENPAAILEEGQQPDDPAGGMWGLGTVVVLLSVEPVW